MEDREVLANLGIAIKDPAQNCHTVTSAHSPLIKVKNMFKPKVNGEESVFTHTAAIPICMKSENSSELINDHRIHKYLRI